MVEMQVFSSKAVKQRGDKRYTDNKSYSRIHRLLHAFSFLGFSKATPVNVVINVVISCQMLFLIWYNSTWSHDRCSRPLSQTVDSVDPLLSDRSGGTWTTEKCSQQKSIAVDVLQSTEEEWIIVNRKHLDCGAFAQDKIKIDLLYYCLLLLCICCLWWRHLRGWNYRRSFFKCFPPSRTQRSHMFIAVLLHVVMHSNWLNTESVHVWKKRGRAS